MNCPIHNIKLKQDVTKDFNNINGASYYCPLKNCSYERKLPNEKQIDLERRIASDDFDMLNCVL